MNQDQDQVFIHHSSITLIHGSSSSTTVANEATLTSTWKQNMAAPTYPTVLSSVLLFPAAAVIFAATVLGMTWAKHKSKVTSESISSSTSTAAAYEALVGKTPLVKLGRISRLIKREVYVKMESLNPGGTGKDRAALGMIRAAESEGRLPKPSCHASSAKLLNSDFIRPTITNPMNDKESETSHPESPEKGTKIDDNTLDAFIRRAMTRSISGGLVVEGTSGSTGIALATLCRSRGHACLVTLPDDQAIEKQRILSALGAVVLVVPTASISHPQHYVNLARRIAERARQKHKTAAVFMNQFENPANVWTHYTETGPEIWQDCGARPIHAFAMSAGTGGTVAGVGRYFKEKTLGKCRVVLVDPPGSVLYHKIQDGIAYTPQQAERSLKRHRYDTIAEGIGLDRVTHNVFVGLEYIDEAIRVTDQEALDMAHWLIQNEGLWVGSSSAMNVVGAIHTALSLPERSRVVTVICDAGSRHVTRFWNRDFCQSWGLVWPQNENNHGSRVPHCLQSSYARVPKQRV